MDEEQYDQGCRPFTDEDGIGLGKSLDTMFFSDEFAKVNEILKQKESELREMSMLEIVTYLTVTFPAHPKLPYRSTFFNSVRSEYERRGIDRIDWRLQGLESSRGPTLVVGNKIYDGEETPENLVYEVVDDK